MRSMSGARSRSELQPDRAIRTALDYAEQGRERFLAELQELMRFPSISAQTRHAGDVRRCAGWLARHLASIGLESACTLLTDGHPIVYADWLHAPDAPTVLIYGHYDVQPADPLDEWISPPFEPAVRGNNLYGRGACDDKGQMFVHVKALESWLAATGSIPVNVRCLFEGEEEIGSASLHAAMPRIAGRIRSDMAILSDMPMPSPGQPAITYAMRGLLSLEIDLCGPKRDLHSGIFGGAVHNPLQGLCEMIASLHDRAAHVAIPGFYNRVRQWGDGERAYMRTAGPADGIMLGNAASRVGWGEREFTLYERTTIRPALTINGIWGGYEGEGGKGIIPSCAHAKLSVRLVPDQDPHAMERLIGEHLRSVTPPGMRLGIRAYSHARPVYIDRSHRVLRSAAAACRRVFGREPVFLRSGGTVPIVDTFLHVLGVPTIMMGFALPGDRMHGPNEKFHLPNFYNGIASSIRFLAEAAKSNAVRD